MWLSVSHMMYDLDIVTDITHRSKGKVEYQGDLNWFYGFCIIGGTHPNPRNGKWGDLILWRDLKG